MGIATFVIGLLPTYSQVGVIAPTLLAIMRFSQGLALGGEWSGRRYSPPRPPSPVDGAGPRCGRNSGSFRIPLGERAFRRPAAVARTQQSEPRPRRCVPHMGLAGAVPAERGDGGHRSVRAIAPDRDAGVHPRCRAVKVKTPVTEVFRTSWRQLIIGTFVMLATYTIFYIVTTWALSFGTGKRPPDGKGLRVRLRRLPATAVDRRVVLRRDAAAVGSRLRPLRP